MKILFVGENFSKPSTPDKALTGNIGRRLAGLLQTTIEKYERDYDRVNLSPGTLWDTEEARKRTWQVVRGYDRIVLLGVRVRLAFGFNQANTLDAAVINGQRFLMLPHPSSRSRWWNDKQNMWNAEQALRKFVQP
jgi:hypothetical protein